MSKSRIIFIALLIFIGFLFFTNIRKSPPLKVQISDSVKGKFLPIIQKYQKQFPKQIEITKDKPDVIIDVKKTKGYRNNIQLWKDNNILEFSGSGFKRRIGSENRVYFNFDKRTNKNLVTFIKKNLIKKRKPEISLTLLGDIVPARSVYEKMLKHGFDYPFKEVAFAASNSDLTFGNFECPITDKIDPPTEGMSFVTPTKVLPGLKSLGLDLVTLANNHSTNYGPQPFVETLKQLKKSGIVYVGGGKDYTEAHALRVINKNGLKIGVLNYNSIIGGLKADVGSPGVAWLHMPPWNKKIDQSELLQMKKEIIAAKTKVDFLIVAIHWGVEYKLEPIKEQVSVAHIAINSGADLVWGSHPHVPSTFEIHKGKLIIYHLGNFIFDQMWSEETREGVIAKLTISGQDIKKIQLTPYKIYDYAQPRILQGNSGRYIIDRMMSKSKFK
jgi:poly-gamma-glutamate synthesis protein (capsule biosynthesis protein)